MTKFPPVVVALATAPVVVVLIAALMVMPPPLPEVARSAPRVIVGALVPRPLIVPPVASMTR